MPNNSPLSVEYTTCLKTSKNGMPCSTYVPIYFHPGLSYTLFKMKYWLCYSGIVSLIDEAMFDNKFDSKFDIWSDGLVVKSLDFQPAPSSKPLGSSKADPAFYPSEVDKMSNRNFWELNGKKETASSKWLQP